MAFLAIYKRDMIIKMFSLNASAPASELQRQLESTADVVISRLENQIAHLELLLDEADEKIAVLDRQLQQADNILIEQPDITENKQLAAAGEVIDLRLPSLQPPPEFAPASSTAAFNDPAGAKDEKEGLNANKRRLISSMATQGYNVTEIAKATGLGKGEVMLFLQLNKK
jgi:hypothetical protein